MAGRSSVQLGLASAAVLGLVLAQQPAPESSLGRLTRPPASAARGTAPELPSITFEDVSLELGIALGHEQSSDPLSSLSETLGAGVCAIDFDRDGFVDLFFVGGSGHTREYGRDAWWREALGNRLLRNHGGRKFEDVTERAGLGAPMWGMGCAAADLDNDGLSDLVVTGVKGNKVFRNRGNATFEDVTQRSGIASDRWSTGAAVADFDGDGLLDVYVSNFILYEKGARTFERTSGFTTSASAFDQTLYDPEPNRLYVNRGGLRFEDVAKSLGVADALGRGLGARFTDVNDDGWPDLLVINDHETPNQLFLNEAGEGFVRAPGSHAAFEVAGSHDVALADFDNDGRREAFMSRGRGQPPVLLALSAAEGRYKDGAWARGAADLRMLPFSSWAAVPADLDNDGHLDLFLANGSTLPDADTGFVPQAQPSRLLHNDRRGGFRGSTAAPAGRRPHSARGAIAVDLDNDGSLELVVAHNNDALEVLKTSGSQGHWLTLDLSAQRDAETFGAIVTARTGKLTLTRVVEPSMHFLSQGDPRIHLGLGEATRVDLGIVWRDGEHSVFPEVEADRIVQVDRRKGTLLAKTSPGAPRPRLASLVDTDDPAALSCLARVLMRAPAREQDLEAVRELWRVAPAVTRVAMLELLPEAMLPAHVALVDQGLRDRTAAVRLTAVRRLRRAELERSVAWLVPLLEDSDAAVQCATAETFRHFFDEEEAVVHRKALAVPPLIRMATGGTPEVQACAADALAAAESTRAVLPLIELARGGGTRVVRGAAVRALGLIRDTRAVEPLRAILAEPNADPAVLSAALIALVRLGHGAVDGELARVLPSDQSRDASAVGRGYELLAQLLTSSESLVLAKPALEGHLLRLLAKHPPRALGRGSDSVPLAALRAISASRSPRALGTVAGLVGSSSAEVRQEAILALARLEGGIGARLVRARLASEAIAVVENVLSRLGAEQPHFVAQTLDALFDRPGGASVATRLLSALPPDAASEALGRLLRKPRTHDQALTLLALCSGSAVSVAEPIAAYEAHPSIEARARYALCLLRGSARRAAPGVPLAEQLRARGLLSETLASEELPGAVRWPVLASAAKIDSVIATTWLARELRDVPNEHLPAALEALTASGASAVATEFLLELLGDAERSTSLRLRVAEVLATSHRQQVMQQLYAQAEAP